MRWATLISAAAIIVIANTVALLHVARNRAGKPTAEITLTNRELGYFARRGGDEDSGVTLNLRWTDSNFLPFPTRVDVRPKWLDQSKLQALGFDCSMNPEKSEAATFYSRQRPRRAFVAMEYDGPAWRAWQAANEQNAAQRQAQIQTSESIDHGLDTSRLVIVDADLNPDKLRLRNPNRGTVVILPAIVAVMLDPLPYPGWKQEAARPVRVTGRIQEIPTWIHVPRPFSDEFRRPHPTPRKGEAVLYRVSLSYGSQLEPWITAVEFASGR